MARQKNQSNKPPRIAVTKEPDELVYAAAETYFSTMQPDEEDDSAKVDGKKKGRAKATKGCATRAANDLKERFDRQDLTRERIYPLIWEAIRRKFVVMNAPIEENLSRQLIEKFDLAQHLEATNGAITVVNVVGNITSQHVGEAAADRIVNLIDKVRKEKEARAIANGEDPENVKVHLGLGAGFTDTFRYLYPDLTGVYSWWSYRFNARKNNAGWRIDYFLVSDRLRDRIREAKIHTDIMGSDHCPVELDIDL